MSTESKMALESLREMQIKLEREVEWIIYEDSDENEPHYRAAHSFIAAIESAMSDLINYLESK